jgi:hypothetical protein
MELSCTGTCTVRYVRCEAERYGRYVVVWYWRCERCGAGAVPVRYRYRYGIKVRYRTGTDSVWTVLIGTVRYRYGTVQYMAEYRAAIRMVFLFFCWGNVVVCECAFEC